MSKINIEELKRWRDYIASLPESAIDMCYFRSDRNFKDNICGSSGCILGHVTALYAADELELSDIGEIDFRKVSKKIGVYDEREKGLVWDYLFSAQWRKAEGCEKELALARMDYVIKNGDIPIGWRWEYDKESCFVGG